MSKILVGLALCGIVIRLVPVSCFFFVVLALFVWFFYRLGNLVCRGVFGFGFRASLLSMPCTK